MTIQFLASVRRNQKQWMVVLTILSIFAFLFDDVVRGANQLTPNAIALIFAVLCAGLMSIIGYPRGHTVMYGLIGFVLGGAAAMVGSSFAGPKPIVRTNIGNLSVRELVDLRTRRTKVNRFLANAMYAMNPQVQQPPSMGDASEPSMVSFMVMQHEARRLGISISDDAVQKFIKDVVRIPVSEFNPREVKLTRQAYETALKESDLGEAELFDLLRDELAVQLVDKMMSPPAISHRFMAQWTGMRGRIPYRSPEQLWDEFRKLHVQESLSVAAVPVSEFEKLAPEPKEADIQEFFNKRKNLIDDERTGNPGFLVLPKVKLAYFAVPFSEKYEKGLSGATDQEIVDYYLNHKEEYRIFEIPEGTAPKFPDDAALEGPADAATPENTRSDGALKLPDEGPEVKPGPEADAEKPTEKKDPLPEESKPDEKPKPEDAPKESAKEDAPKDKAPEEDAQKESPCGDDDQPAQKESPDKDPSPAKPDDTAKPDEPAAEPKDPAAKDPAPKDPEQPAKGSPDKPVSPAGEEATLPAPSIELPPDDAVPPGPSSPLNPAKPKYRELDDDLKLEIREKLLLEKAFAKMGMVRFDAFQTLMELSVSYNRDAKTVAERKKRDEAAAQFAEKCRAYADEHGIEYHETRELTYRELSNLNIEPIGSATRSADENASRRDQQTVADMVFDTGMGGRPVKLYDPQTADSPKARYAYWKIAEIPSHEPELKTDPNDPLRQRVITEWKKDQARGLAEKRATELATLARTTPEDFAKALSGQTINGSPQSPAVTVTETPKFSWLRGSPSFPTMGQGLPTESVIVGVSQPGPDFMKLVFDQLAEGEVGVGLNMPRDTYYVVRVRERDGAGDDGGVSAQALHQQFMRENFTTAEAGNRWMGFPTSYDYLGVINIQSPLDNRYQQNFRDRFAVKFEQPMQDDEMEEE